MEKITTTEKRITTVEERIEERKNKLNSIASDILLKHDKNNYKYLEYNYNNKIYCEKYLDYSTWEITLIKDFFSK